MSEINAIKKHLSDADPVLAKIIAEVPYPSIELSGSVFHDLMSVVIEQQIHYRSTKKTFERLLNQVEISELTPDNFHLLEEIGFGNARLSENKFHTMNEVIELFTGKEINWDELSNDEIKDQLKQIKGIGPKTIDALLIYTFQRDDVFIHDDYHIQKIIPSLYGLDADKKLTAKIKELSKNWSPYASHAFRYLLAWKDQNKKK
jgi:DNA-3-methyladenine glycosylase II